MYNDFPFSTSSPTFVICKLFDDSYSDLCVVLICISLIISDFFPLFFLLSLAKDVFILCIFKKQKQLSVNLGETVTYCGLEGVFLCGSVAV